MCDKGERERYEDALHEYYGNINRDLQKDMVHLAQSYEHQIAITEAKMSRVAFKLQTLSWVLGLCSDAELCENLKRVRGLIEEILRSPDVR